MPSFLVKRSSAADNLLLFLVTAASSVLLTRLYLYLFDYPQIGRGQFHIAHAIIGGALLTISCLLLLSFHGRRVRQFSAVLAGWGFGLFIDEIGKFITRDNNYFYQPAPVIIYLCFIIFFFIYRRLDRYTPKDARELSYDLIEKLEDLADNRFFQQNRVAIENTISKILHIQRKSHNYFAQGVMQLLAAVPVWENPRPHRIYTNLRTSWKWLDDFAAERRPVFYFLIGVFVVYVGLTFWTMTAFLYRLHRDTLDPVRYGLLTRTDWFVYVAELSSQFVSALWMCQGFWRLVRRQRRRALILFKNGLAINILVTHVFAFYIEQFSAAISLMIMLVLFVLVENILEENESE